MRMRRLAIIGAFLAVPLVAGAFLRQSPQAQDGAKLFAQVLQRIEDNSVDSLSRSAIYEKAAGPDHPAVATVLSNLGQAEKAEGRYADVWVQECRECHLLWLRYAVEYEGFSKSGRWARRHIGQPDAETITPERAVGHVENGSYVYGGSYFDGASGWRKTPMRWGL